MLENNNNNLVFSSSAAIFGDPTTNTIDESHQKKPINPYGKSKLIVENILEDLCKYSGLNASSLRYFNAAGADFSNGIGEAHNPETHLIPNILISAIKDKGSLKIFGKNHNTKDGTCIRDYVHVLDLAQAHLNAIKFLKSNKGFYPFNLGNGDGFSVLEVVKECEKTLGRKINYEFSEARRGDPPVLIANSEKAEKLLLWKKEYSSLDQIISSAYEWHRSWSG